MVFGSILDLVVTLGCQNWEIYLIISKKKKNDKKQRENGINFVEDWFSIKPISYLFRNQKRNNFRDFIFLPNLLQLYLYFLNLV